jgi:hypothetical protein
VESQWLNFAFESSIFVNNEDFGIPIGAGLFVNHSRDCVLFENPLEQGSVFRRVKQIAKDTLFSLLHFLRKLLRRNLIFCRANHIDVDLIEGCVIALFFQHKD